MNTHSKVIKPLKVGVYIGRFQPYHDEHARILDFALFYYDMVIVIIGSHQWRRTRHNPWFATEREEMIRLSIDPDMSYKLRVHYQQDYPNSDLEWATRLVTAVHDLSRGFYGSPQIYLLGANKDASSFYLKIFPEWKLDLSSVDNPTSATQVRNEYFANKRGRGANVWKKHVPFATGELLGKFKTTPLYKELAALPEDL